MSFASNDVDTQTLFEMRRLYNINYGSYIPEFVNFRDKRYFYGRVDREFDAVMVKGEGVLKAFAQEERVMALNFVVDAFEAMKRYINLCITRGNLGDDYEDAFVHDMKVKKGWTSLNVLYDDYLKEVNTLFVSTYIPKMKLAKRICSLDSYVNQFLEFYNNTDYVAPLTKSNFALTTVVSPNTSGLCFDISSEDHSVDSPKVEDYFASRYFGFYVATARKFGFLVDQNAPWRLVANIASPLMRKYMAPYGVNADNFFEKYYTKLYPNDMEILKRYLVLYYNLYAQHVPKTRTFQTELVGGQIVTKTKTIRRKGTTYRPELDKDASIVGRKTGRALSDDFWLAKYYIIKSREAAITVDHHKLRRELRKIYILKKNVDIGKALKYINDSTKNTFRDGYTLPPPKEEPIEDIVMPSQPEEETGSEELRGAWKLAPVQGGIAPRLIPKDVARDPAAPSQVSENERGDY